MEDAQQIQALILQKDGKFQRACAQVLLLNNMVQDLQTRYDRAVAQNMRQYRYTLRLRLCTVEGLRNMYTMSTPVRVQMKLKPLKTP